MEAVLTRLKGLTADELREEFARADLKCVAITASTRSIFEKKLARMLVGSEGDITERDSGSPARDSDGVASAANHDKPLLCAKSTVATSCSPNEELDFGYGVGLNPPEEEEISNSQAKTKTPSKVAQVSPAFYYGVCPSWEDILSRNGHFLVAVLTQYFNLYFQAHLKLVSMLVWLFMFTYIVVLSLCNPNMVGRQFQFEDAATRH